MATSGNRNAKNSGQTDNDHQKMVSGKNQKGPANKIGRDAGGNEGSRGQNRRTHTQGARSVGSHKPSGDGPGTKKFKHESDSARRGEN
jgi:hypothetical protein